MTYSFRDISINMRVFRYRIWRRFFCYLDRKANEAVPRESRRAGYSRLLYILMWHGNVSSS